MPSHNVVQANNGAYKLQALDRAFAVLDLPAASCAALGLAEIATSLCLHKSTAHRFLMVLERHRMVERTQAGKFRLGLRLCDFGSRAIEQFDLRERAQHHLRTLGRRGRRDGPPVHSGTDPHGLYRQAGAGTEHTHDFAGGREQPYPLHGGGQGDAGNDAPFAGGGDVE